MKIEDFKVGEKYKKIGGCARVGQVVTCESNNGCSVVMSGLGTYTNLHWFEPLEPWTPKFGELIHLQEKERGDIHFDLKYHYIGETAEGCIITVEEGDTYEDNTPETLFIWDKSFTPFKIEEEKPKVELTLSEIADKLNIDVDQLRIKE